MHVDRRSNTIIHSKLALSLKFQTRHRTFASGRMRWRGGGCQTSLSLVSSHDFKCSMMFEFPHLHHLAMQHLKSEKKLGQTLPKFCSQANLKNVDDVRPRTHTPLLSKRHLKIKTSPNCKKAFCPQSIYHWFRNSWKKQLKRGQWNIF